ncbi:uncharacterized protein LOC131182425 [Hevea brasiliensis]|uniref:uncharacterized protein LOC131182425 n=1 Tax=Hevea brasiliensis TaxID=3981 RepID=UPI0025D45B9F|nr:uncharacterized protein LOC131182425 [Hevea brasiliensis]
MAHTKRKTPAATSSSSSSSEELPVAALKKKLKEKKKTLETESTSVSSDPSKEVEPAVTTPKKKKGRKMRGIDTQHKKGATKSLTSVVDKALLDCKFIKWDNFDQVNFQFKELFEFQEWMNVCECIDVYYLRLVQEFYKTLKIVDKEDRIEVSLNNRANDISVELIAKALKLPNEGNKISTHRDVTRVPGFNLAEFENEVFPANTATSEKSTSTKAFQHIKIIHSMVNYIFCPKSGSYGYLSYLDMYIMWHIINRVRMNLAYLIFKNMCKAYGIGKLPYAHLLTALFRELDINVSKESSRVDLIVLREIHSDTDGRKKRFEKGGSSKAKVGSDSQSEIMSELQGLITFINEKFSTSNQSIELLRKFMDVVDYKVTLLLMVILSLIMVMLSVEVVELTVEPVVEKTIEPAVESPQKKEASLTDQQESAPPNPSTAETLAAALQIPSDEDEPQEHEPLSDQVSQPPNAKLSWKKMFATVYVTDFLFVLT